MDNLEEIVAQAQSTGKLRDIQEIILEIFKMTGRTPENNYKVTVGCSRDNSEFPQIFILLKYKRMKNMIIVCEPIDHPKMGEAAIIPLVLNMQYPWGILINQNEAVCYTADLNFESIEDKTSKLRLDENIDQLVDFIREN